MIIASLSIELFIPMVGSLKEKRRIIRSVIERSKNKFNIAAAEVDKNDLWKNATIGIVTVSNDRVYIEKLFSKVIAFIDGYNEVELINYSIEFF